jgi:hypothetical protein
MDSCRFVVSDELSGSSELLEENKGVLCQERSLKIAGTQTRGWTLC